jgi:hypothetical protein
MFRKRTTQYKQGIYKVCHKEKYKGNVNNCIYRSSLELRAFRFMDHNPNVLEWSSEEVIIPYKNPLDKSGKLHRYFVDLYAKIQNKEGIVKKYLIEIKPSSQVVPPKPSRNTKGLLKRQAEYVKNRAKWDSATQYGKQKGMIFTILTEKHLVV